MNQILNKEESTNKKLQIFSEELQRHKD